MLFLHLNFLKTPFLKSLFFPFFSNSSGVYYIYYLYEVLTICVVYKFIPNVTLYMHLNIYEGLQICKIYLSRDVDPHGHASL